MSGAEVRQAQETGGPAARYVSPPWSEIERPDRFVPALSPGERQLLQYLHEQLPTSWRLYVRPHLDADRPLLAALHPTYGGVVWDVIDWDLREFQVDQGRWISTGSVNGRFHSPFRFLDQVRDRLYGVYAPEIGEALNEDPDLRPISAALYFSNSDTVTARSLAAGDPAARDIGVVGRDALVPQQLRQVVPLRDGGSDFRPTWYETLHTALSHEHARPEALDLIEMTRDQRRVLIDTPAFTAIDGVVGSGKTLVLVHAAARAAKGGSVLLLTYNRTLTNYLRWLVQRVPGSWPSDAITILHFHDLCRRIHDHHREDLPSGFDSDKGIWLDRDWPLAATGLLRERGIPPALVFSTVLIDEAQDYTAEYLEVVAALRPGRVMVAYDSAQRLYEGRDTPTPTLLAKALGGRQWQPRRLTQAVRLPKSIAEMMGEYALRWNVEGLPVQVAEHELLLAEGSVGVISADSVAVAAASVMQVLETWRQESHFQPREVAVLVPTISFGTALVRVLAENGFSSNHTFPVRATGAVIDSAHPNKKDPPWRIALSRKTNFAVEDSRLKVSTIHSFKGWEAQRVIAVLPSTATSGRVARTVYVMLTRSRGDLVLIGKPGEFRIDDLVPGYSVSARYSIEFAARFLELYQEALDAHGGSRA